MKKKSLAAVVIIVLLVIIGILFFQNRKLGSEQGAAIGTALIKSQVIIKDNPSKIPSQEIYDAAYLGAAKFQLSLLSEKTKAGTSIATKALSEVRINDGTTTSPLENQIVNCTFRADGMTFHFSYIHTGATQTVGSSYTYTSGNGGTGTCTYGDPLA